MWHASGRSTTLPLSRALAWRALDGVGDADLGQWSEHNLSGTVHYRRRLSDAEVERSGLVVRDIRGTQEEQARLAALLRDAPYLAGLLLQLKLGPGA